MSYRSTGEEILNGESSILGAMLIMGFGSFILTFFLWWIPVIGVFIGPVVAGFVGGRRAGTGGRAFLAAILPGILLTLSLMGLASIVGFATHNAAIGLIGGLIAAVAGVAAVAHSVVLVVAALAGGISRQVESM